MASLSNYNLISLDPNTYNYSYIGNSHKIKTINTSSIIASGISLSNIFFNDYFHAYNLSLIMTNTGNVGINKDTVDYKLDVKGTGKIDNIITDGTYINGINASNIKGILSESLLPLYPGNQYNRPAFPIKSQVTGLNVDQYGRIFDILFFPISIPNTKIVDLAKSATIDTTNATNITSGLININTIPSSFNGNYIGNANKINNINATNIKNNKLDILLFPNTGVVPGTYGDRTNTASITVDNYGRMISISNTPLLTLNNNIITNVSNILIGSLSTSRYPTSGVISGSYGGSSTNNVNLTVDQYGRITSISNVTSYTFPIVSYNKVEGLSSSATIDTTNITNITRYYNKNILPSTIRANYLSGDGYGLGTINASNCIGSIPLNCFPITSVNPGTYGSSTNNFSISIDIYGRVTSISNIVVSNNIINTISNASNILSGVIPVVNLPKYSSSGNYGSSTNSIGITIDEYGRVLSCNTNTYNFDYTDISGLSSTSTTNNDSLSYYSDLATNDIYIGNINRNNNVYINGYNINLNSKTNTITNFINGANYQIPLYTSSLSMITGGSISIPLNFNLINYNNIDIKLYIYTNSITNVTLTANNTLNNIINPSETHNYFQYGNSLGSGSSISTTNITDTTSNVIINASKNNTIYINMNISKSGFGGSNYYLIDSSYYNTDLNRILHGASSGLLISSSTTNVNNCLFNIQNGLCQYRWSAINYY